MIYDIKKQTHKEQLETYNRLKGQNVWCWSEEGGNVNYGKLNFLYINYFGVETLHQKHGKFPKAYRFISLQKPHWIP